MRKRSPGFPLLAVLLVTVMVIPLLPGSNAAAGDEALSLITLVKQGRITPEKAWEAFDTANLNFFDVDNNGLPELITQNDNNRVYVLDPRNGTILAELTTNHPGGDSWGAREVNGVAVGDVDQDGNTDLVVANSAAYLTLFSFNPAQSNATHFDFVERWEQLVDVEKFEPDFYEKNQWANDTEQYPGLDGNPYIADVDGDGKQEIFIQTDGKPGHFSFSPEGELRWMKPWHEGNSGPMVTDLDGDGDKEAVFTTDGGAVVAYDADSGAPKWTFKTSDHGADPGSIAVMPVVVDVDNDGKKEVFVAARQAVKEGTGDDWIREQHAHYFGIDHNGDLLWESQFKPWGNPHVYMRPAAVDVNEDDVLDLVWVDWNTIGHKPGNWELTGRPTNLIAVDGKTGEDIWHREVDATWSNKDIAVADVDGDGRNEVLVEDQDTGGEDGLSLYAMNGMRKGHVPAPAGWNVARGPVLADLYGDGHIYVALPLYRNATGCERTILDVGCREGAIAIYRGEGKLDNATWTNNVLYNADLSDALDPHNDLPEHLTTRPPPPETRVEPPGPIKENEGGGLGATLPGPGAAATVAGVALAVVARAGGRAGRGRR